MKHENYLFKLLSIQSTHYVTHKPRKSFFATYGRNLTNASKKWKVQNLKKFLNFAEFFKTIFFSPRCRHASFKKNLVGQ